MELAELLAMIKAASLEMKTAQDRHDVEFKELGKVSDAAKLELKTALEGQTEMKAMIDKVEEKLVAIELESKRLRDNAPTERKSMGQIFTGNAIYDGIKSANRGSMSPVAIERKDITSLTASAGALIRPDRDPEVYRNPSRPIRIRDLISSVPTSSSSIETMRQNVFTNNAGPQGTVAGIGGGEFVAKNQSELSYELIIVTVKTIAHWFPASRQVLSDAPMLAGLIDTELAYGLQLESDNQLLLGDGTGQNFTGIMVDAGISDIAKLPAGTAAADIPAAMINHIRKALTTIQTFEYYNSNGVILNPLDWERLETAKATDGHYLMIQFPTEGASERIWRMPVVVTNAMPANSFVLGDFTMGAKIYDRESIEIRVSESHADYFVKNGVAILGEERYAFSINRPKAMCKGSFLVTP
jgi:HK97 family phage major capsid protein